MMGLRARKMGPQTAETASLALSPVNAELFPCSATVRARPRHHETMQTLLLFTSCRGGAAALGSSTSADAGGPRRPCGWTACRNTRVTSSSDSPNLKPKFKGLFRFNRRLRVAAPHSTGTTHSKGWQSGIVESERTQTSFPC